MEATSPTAPATTQKRKSRPLAFGLGKEKDYLIENLSLLIGAGLDVLAALTLLRSDVKSSSMRRILDDTIFDITSGSPLWKALEESRLFPPYMIALIHTGEESGKLVENLKVVALQDERDRIFKSEVRSAMMYPIFVFLFTLAVGSGVAWFILPRLATVFYSLHIQLPLITRILISTGQWLGKYGAVAVPIFLCISLSLLFIVFFFRPTKFIGQALLFCIPGIKKLLQELELSRLGYLLGTLLEAGIPINTAVTSLVEATFFPAYQKLYRHLELELEEGITIQKSLASYRHSNHLIPVPVQGMIAAGEQSGTMAATFLHLGQTFSAKTEATTKNLTTLLEPLLLVFIWLGVMAVALAVFLPIYGLIGGLDQQIAPTNQGAVHIPSPVNKLTATSTAALPMQLASSTLTTSSSFSTSSTSTSSTLLSEPSLHQLIILPTKLGFANVRDYPSTKTGKIIIQARSGTQYPYILSQAGWYKITITTDTAGWVNGDYVKPTE